MSLNDFIVVVPLCSCRFLGDRRRFSQKTSDTPDGHDHVENHRRPQRHAVHSKSDAGESEDGDGSDVVKQHRGDQSSRGAALRVTSRKPACDTQRKQPGPADTRHGQGGGCLQRRAADQERHHRRRETQQRQTGSQFNQSGHGVQSFHGRGTVEEEPIEGTGNVFSVLFVGSGAGFIFFCVATLVGRFGFARQVAGARQSQTPARFDKPAPKGLAAIACPP